MSGGTPKGKRDLKSAEISPNQPSSKLPKMSMEELIAKLEGTISTLSSEITSLRDSNTSLNSTVQTLNENVTALEERLKKNSDSLTENIWSVQRLESEIKSLRKENNILKDGFKELGDKVADLEYHQKRNNLIFEGFPEGPKKESWCCISTTKLIDCLYNIVDTSEMKIARCHRLGPFKSGYNRPIIANFLWYGDIMNILNEKKNLPKGIYVKVDIPKKWDERSRLLRPMYKKLREHAEVADQVKLTKGRLIVKGDIYQPDNLSELAGKYPQVLPGEQESDTAIGFLGPGTPF